jgi:hypothetical protein
MMAAGSVSVQTHTIEAANYGHGGSTTSENRRRAKTVSRRPKHGCLAQLYILLIAATLLGGVIGCEPATDYSEIRTWHDLHAIRNNLGGHYLLMNDLDSGTSGYGEFAGKEANQGKGWQPIGTTDDPFTGSFDGQGYEIAGMFIDRPDEYWVGFFGAVDETGAVQDVKVVNANVTGEWAVGCLAGENWGDVSNSYSSGAVSGDDCVGGLIGTNSGSVSSCHSVADVKGRWDVGGLVGCSDSTGIICNSHSVGNVTGEWAVGGLAGGNVGGIVERSYSTSDVTGDDYVGGLVGDNQGTVIDSYSCGPVTGEWYVGGLVGDNDSLATVSYCYASNTVTGYSFVGGLAGSNWGTVSDSFWNLETSGMTESDGGVGLTTAEMNNIVTFSETGWNIIAVVSGQTNSAYVWNIVDGQTCPFLSRQS